MLRVLIVPYLQVELRVMAALSGDEALQAAFAKGQDVHAATAREMLGKGPQVLPVGEVAVCVCVCDPSSSTAAGLRTHLCIMQSQRHAAWP